MSEKYQYSYLLLDETLMRENVWFSQKFDCIEGFEDLGSRGRMCNIVNHALLFMVCGLHWKWKQPVTYYFSHGSTKAEILILIYCIHIVTYATLDLSNLRNKIYST